MKLEICEDNEGPEDVALHHQLKEEKYLEENQEELQEDQSLDSSKSCFVSFLLIFSLLLT